MRLNFFLVLTFFTTLFGCAATPVQIEEIYQKQTELEAETELLSQGIEALRSQVLSVEEANSKLKKRIDALEKKQASSSSPVVKSPDALYGLAESYYRKGKYEEAVIEFQRFIDTYPKNSRVPDSYLKQGLSLINIGRKQEARFFLETLINKFPESKESKIAREKLRELSS
ncbi:MAG: tetratricopeptide repeat protein [Candidatus Dadabacteria bacterium]|nr:tetratricopeptide repeat protein [Candidatus Dadabacteria bacterium]